METRFFTNNHNTAKKALKKLEDSEKVSVRFWDLNRKPCLIIVRHRDLTNAESAHLKENSDGEVLLTMPKVKLLTHN